MTGSPLDTDVGREYLTSQLIPYIGNKRRLLPFLYRVFSGLENLPEIPVFIDPFAGSGAVSRLAKAMGMAVRANDWEPYAEVLNGCHVALDERDISGLFSDRGGMDAVLGALNEGSGPFTPYISRHYAPVNTETADYRTERLFYTPENGRFIDRVRERIDRWYPDMGPERTILLASLVYQAAVRSNTSGVFKACHKGFGGHGADALGRIMTGIRLQRPCLIDGRSRCSVHRLDAADFASRHPADICYLDPPYNTHQYGSNYHLLNTIALWDTPEVDNSRGPDGRLNAKAAIRKDWTATRSPFCSKRTAADALGELLDAVDARHIVLSYNTEGIVPFEVIYDILERRGRVDIQVSDYTTYRGGRQSISRKVSNLEFLIVCRTDRPASPGGREKAAEFLLRRRLYLLLKESFVPGRLARAFGDGNGTVSLSSGGPVVPSIRHYRFENLPSFEALGRLAAPAVETVCRSLEGAACRDRKEESEVLIDLLAEELSPEERKYFAGRLLIVLRKFAHKKYREEFEEVSKRLRELIDRYPGYYGGLAGGLSEIEALACRRFNG